MHAAYLMPISAELDSRDESRCRFKVTYDVLLAHDVTDFDYVAICHTGMADDSYLSWAWSSGKRFGSTTLTLRAEEADATKSFVARYVSKGGAVTYTSAPFDI